MSTATTASPIQREPPCFPSGATYDVAGGQQLVAG
jgi:hypothetical protein